MKKSNEPSAFEKTAARNSGSFLRDLWYFLKTNKKWWLLPILVLFVSIGLLMLLSSTGVAPFIYSLF